MNKINAIVTSLVFAGGVGTASGMDTYDMVSQEVQVAAAQHASFNGEMISVNVGGFIQTGWSYNNAGGNSALSGFGVDRGGRRISRKMGNEIYELLIGRY